MGSEMCIRDRYITGHGTLYSEVHSSIADRCTQFSVHRWSITGHGTLYSEVHSSVADRYTQFSVHQWYIADRCTVYSEVHSSDHRSLYSVQRSIFFRPQIAEQCTAKYILPTTDRCTQFAVRRWYITGHSTLYNEWLTFV